METAILILIVFLILLTGVNTAVAVLAAMKVHKTLAEHDKKVVEAAVKHDEKVAASLKVIADLDAIAQIKEQMDAFEKRSADSNKAVVEFLLKFAENLDKRIVEINKHLGDEIYANAEDVAEVKTSLLKLMNHRNLVDVDVSLEQYLKGR